MAFNPYSAGAKRYRGAGTAANAGRTLDPTGYVDRSANQRAANAMMQRAGHDPQSQSRSGLAQSATSRAAGPIPKDKTFGGPKRPNDHGPLQINKPITGGPAPVTPTIPIAPPPREPNPTWRLPQQQMQPIDTSNFFAGEEPTRYTGPPMTVGGGGGIPQMTPLNLPDRITGGPVMVPPQPDQGMPMQPRRTNPYAATNTGRNQVRPTVSAPPKTTPAAPSVRFPNLPKFGNMSGALDQDLRAQRNSGFASLNDQIVQIQTLINDIQQEYQTSLQGLERERGQEFMSTAGDFGSRGMLSGSGYGQAYTDLTRDFTDHRNLLDTTLGQGQTQALQTRQSAVTAFQNLLNELMGAQSTRDAQEALEKALASASKGKGSGSGSGGGSSKAPTKQFASSSPTYTYEDMLKTLEGIRNRGPKNPTGATGWY